MHFFSLTTSALFTLALCASDVTAHATFQAVKGANGKTGKSFGLIDPKGEKLRVFNQASRYIKGDDSPCGSQKLDGKKQTPINQAKEMAKAIAAGLPSFAADGSMELSVLQINADGAGPFRCEVSTDGTGKSFKEISVTKQVPGTQGKSSAANKSFQMNIKFPAGTKCSGNGGSCLVRCKNALNQPFGGCFAVTSGSGGKALSNKSVPKASVAKRGARLSEEDFVVRDVEDVEDVAEDVEESSDVEDAQNEYVPRAISRVFDTRAIEERESVDLAKLFGSDATA